MASIVRCCCRALRYNSFSYKPYQRHLPAEYSYRHFHHIPSAFAAKFEDTNPAAIEAESLLPQIESESSSPPVELLSRVVQLAQSASNQGSPRGKTILGSLYREGVGVDKDHTAAVRLFGDAAAEGDPIAQCSLGSLLLERVNEKRRNQDGTQISATELFVDIDQDGKPHARIELETEDGKPLKDAPTPAELVRRVRKARKKAGFTDDQLKEFADYERQQAEEKLVRERKVAMDWLQKAVAQGNDTAMVVLGNEMLQEDAHKAIEFYEKAVKSSRNTDAYFNLGQIYTNGTDEIKVNEQVALKNFAMAAQLGDASAQFYLGHLYRVGSEYVQVDMASSRQYLELAVEQGHPAAFFYLAVMHRDGEAGLEKSEGVFRRYTTESAKLGYGPANECLGDMYYKGTHGVDVDFKKSLMYFTEAGKLGESDALCSAAAMHFHGHGTTRDQHQAFLLYQEAAQLGSIRALRNISSMYFHGHGVPTNKKVAEQFLKMADETEKEQQKAANEHEQSGIKTAEAPKHPMADIPKELVDPSLDSSAGFFAPDVPEGTPALKKESGK